MAAPSATQDEMQVSSHWLRHDGRQWVAASVGGASYEPRRRRRTASCCLTAYTPKQGHIADARGVILVLPLRFDGVDQEVKWGSSLGDGSWGFAGTLQTVWTWLFWLLWDVVFTIAAGWCGCEVQDLWHSSSQTSLMHQESKEANLTSGI